MTEKVDLVGIEYLWKAMLVAPENIVSKPIELLKDIYTNLSTKLQQDQVHSQFILVCINRLQVIYEGLKQYQPGEVEQEGPEIQQGHKTEVCIQLRICVHVCVWRWSRMDRRYSRDTRQRCVYN